jgi:hypothetical protein
MSENVDPLRGWNESLDLVVGVMRGFLSEFPKMEAVIKLRDVLMTQGGTPAGREMTCLMLSVALLRLCEKDGAEDSGGGKAFPA